MAQSILLRLCVLTMVFLHAAAAAETVYDLLTDLPFCALTCSTTLPMGVCGFKAILNFKCQCTAPGKAMYNNAMAMCVNGIGGCSRADAAKYHRVQSKICSVYKADPAAATLTGTTATMAGPTPGMTPGASGPTPGTPPGAMPTTPTSSHSTRSSSSSKTSSTSKTSSSSKSSSPTHHPSSPASARTTSRTTTHTSSSPPPPASFSSSSSSSSSSSGLSTGASAGIGVGVALGVLLIAGAVAALFILSRRRRRRNAGPIGLAYENEEPKLPDQGPPPIGAAEVSGYSSPATLVQPNGAGAGGAHELPAEPRRQPHLATGDIYELPAI